MESGRWCEITYRNRPTYARFSSIIQVFQWLCVSKALLWVYKWVLMSLSQTKTVRSWELFFSWEKLRKKMLYRTITALMHFCLWFDGWLKELKYQSVIDFQLQNLNVIRSKVHHVSLSPKGSCQQFESISNPADARWLDNKIEVRQLLIHSQWWWCQQEWILRLTVIFKYFALSAFQRWHVWTSMSTGQMCKPDVHALREASNRRTCYPGITVCPSKHTKNSISASPFWV